MDESAVQLCAELPFFGSVVKRLSHILHMDGSTVQLCPELPILTIFFAVYKIHIFFSIYSKKYMFYEQKKQPSYKNESCFNFFTPTVVANGRNFHLLWCTGLGCCGGNNPYAYSQTENHYPNKLHQPDFQPPNMALLSECFLLW